ncbi:MAG: hypothetical protein WA484_05430 [Solirubrobacteraceae bacterium]
MTRLGRAWGSLEPEQRLAAVAALALLLTMFFPWYELQSLNRKTGAIDSRSISAFGDVSFVEAAVFLVAAGVGALLFARAERRDFHMPGSDGTVVMVAGGWAALLIFYRVFSRPAGHGYPVGIQWGFFLAFVAAGVLTYAGWRMRATATPEPPLMRSRTRRRPATGEDITVVAPSPQRAERSTPVAAHPAEPSEETTHVVARGPQRAQGSAPVMADRPQSPPRTNPSPPIQQASPSSSPPAATRRAAGSRPRRPRYPPKPSDQLSFEDQPPERDER